MSRRTRVALGALVLAVATVALSATAAFAAPSYTVSLTPSTTSLHYGDEFTLQPSVVGTSTLAFSTVTIEKSWDGVNWNTDGLEGLKTDGDTGTVDPIDPMYFVVDESLLPPTYPIGPNIAVFFRAIYKPVDAAAKALPASENQTSAPTAITLVRYSRVKASTSAPRYASRKRSFLISSSTSPDSGIGLMRVTISKRGFKRSYLVWTDESGTADLRVKLKKSTYKVQSRWVGNVFGKASPLSKTKTVTVR
jgi:hypothetical protein